MSWLEGVRRDLRQGVRVLLKSPVFTGVAIASLAIGIGANTAVFSLVDTVLLRTLPVQHPEELVVLGWSAKEHPPDLSSSYSVSRGGGSYGRWNTNVFSWPAFQSIRGNGVFADAIGFSQMPRLTLTVRGESTVTNGLAVSGNYFRALGVAMAAGRPLQDDDDHEAGVPAAVISYGLWDRSFGADPGIIGKTVFLNRSPHMIVGVTRRGFFGVSVLGFFRAQSVDVMLPILARQRMDPLSGEIRSWLSPQLCWVQMMGRLKPGGTPAAAASQLAPLVLGALPDRTAAFLRDQAARVDLPSGAHGLDYGRSRFLDPFQVLAGVVLLTLLMACANLAGLLLARAMVRTREISIRLALGAGRRRLIRQLVTENALLAIAGSAGGLLLAWWGVHSLLAVTADGQFGIPIAPQLDGRVLGFTLASGVLATLLFGLAPAFRATRVDLARGMKAVGTATGSFGGLRTLVAIQIAIALLLVVGATLAARTLSNLREIPLGFQARNLTVFTLDAGRNGYDEAQRSRLYANLLESFRRLPGVVSASASAEIPMSGFNSSTSVKPEGSSERVSTRLNGISPGFFETLQIPVVAGRVFAEREMNGAAIAVVNETAARRIFGTPLAVGRRFEWWNRASGIEVVGVVKDAKYDRLKGDPPPTVYVPWTQLPWGKPASLGFTVLTAGREAATLAAIRRTVRDADAMLPLLDVKTMQRQIDEAVEQERLLAWLVSLFGGITLLLACVGLYGMMTYMINSRTREIGVRVALGAGRRAVIGLVARQVLVTVAAGLALGIPSAWVAGRFVESLLYGVKAHDGWSFVTAAGVVLAIASVAAFGPLRRALQIDPARTLRYE